MTKELPPTMVNPDFRSVIYANYGLGLHEIKKYASALEANNEAISIRRMLVNDDPARHSLPLGEGCLNMGLALTESGKYDDAIAAFKEVVEVCTAMSAHNPPQYNELMATTLDSYGFTLAKSNQFSEAAELHKQAVSLFRNLLQTGHECTTSLCDALHNYGSRCYSLGEYAESVVAFQESIVLRRALVATDSEDRDLILSLHDVALSFLALGKHAEANAAANEALERNHGKVFEGCGSAPNFKLCFVCHRALIPDSLPNVPTPLPVLLANSSSRTAGHPGADAPIAPAEIPKLAGETVNVSVHKRRQKILGFFRRNRAQ